MNLLDVFRRAESCAEQEQAGKQCASKEVDFSHAVSESGRQLTIGPALARCKAASAPAWSSYLIFVKESGDRCYKNAGIHVILFESCNPCEGNKFAPIIQCLCGVVCRVYIRRILAGRNRVSRKNAGAL